MTNEIQIGQWRAESGSPYRVEEIDDDRRRVRIRVPRQAASGSWWTLEEIERDPIVDAPINAPALEPAPAPAEDRKARGVKPPLALIPWGVVPRLWRPEIFDLAFDDGETLDPEGPESFASRVIRILLETEGDDLMHEIARAMGHGAEKYGIGNWQTATWDDRARVEYESALMRHLYADATGEATDPDSGLAHKAHAAASAMIIEWHDRRAARASEDA